MKKLRQRCHLRIKSNLLCCALFACVVIPAQAERIYLSGKGPEDAKLWDFKVSAGRKSDEWIFVKSKPMTLDYDFGHPDGGGGFNWTFPESGINSKARSAPPSWMLPFPGGFTSNAARCVSQSPR